MNVNSLPDRPLGRSEFEALREAESVDTAHDFAARGGPEGEAILQFVLDVDDDHVALHFDPFEESWRAVHRSESFEAAAQALADARGD
jgi:hypothetical protein